jgi:hypothetical protein
MIVKTSPLTPSTIVAGVSLSAAPSLGAIRTSPRNAGELGGDIYGANSFALQQSVTGIPIMRDDFITYTDLMPAE